MTTSKLPRGLFVTGTDTGVGKTHVTCLIAKQLTANGLRVGVYKPVCSGANIDAAGHASWDDIDRLKEASGIDWPLDAICPQRFLAALAPPLAARAEGRTVSEEMLSHGVSWWSNRVDSLIVEGAGGLLSPVSDAWTVADLAREVGYPILIVARCGLGTINHSLLTVEAARRRGLKVAGIVLNQSRPDDDLALAPDNAAEIEVRSGVPVFGMISWRTTHGLQRHGRTVTIHWQSICDD